MYKNINRRLPLVLSIKILVMSKHKIKNRKIVSIFQRKEEKRQKGKVEKEKNLRLQIM